MTDFYPQVIKIGEIQDVPDSHSLEYTIVMNEYPVVMKKGLWKTGDLAAFLCYDSVVPDNEFFHFLAPAPKLNKDGTVKTPTPPVGSVPIKYRTIIPKRIRGFYSEGMLVEAPPNSVEGDSVIEYYGITKRVYDEELPDLPDKGTNENEAHPKTFNLGKYDLEGIAKYAYVFEEGEPVIIHEKIEGENCTFIYAEDKLWVKSRNWFKKKSETSHWWEIPFRMDLETKLKEYPNLAFQGELYGNVKGFHYDCPIVDHKIQREFRVFDILDVAKHKHLEWEQVEELCAKIGFKTVPELYKGPWRTDRSLHTLAEGKSLIGTSVKEGFVVRSMPNSHHNKLGRKILKLKGRDYKLFKG